MTKITFSTREEWKQERAKYITASDIAALVQYYFKDHLTKNNLFLHSYTSAFEIFHRMKNNYKRPEPDIQMRYLFNKGHACERPMAQYFMEKYQAPVQVSDEILFYVSDEIDDLACTPDFIIEELQEEIQISNNQYITKEDGLGLLEAKTIRYDQYCNKYFDGEPPFQFLLQLQTQMICTGAKWGVIVTDNGYGVEEFFFKSDKHIAKLIKESLRKFKHDLNNNIELEPTSSTHDSDITKHMFEITDEYNDASDDEKLEKLCTLFKECKEIEVTNKKKCTEINNQIRMIIAGYKVTETETHRISISKNNRLTIKKR